MVSAYIHPPFLTFAGRDGDDVVGSSQRREWKRLLAELPALPVGTRNGKRLLLPYTGEQTAKSHNGENPELYAIYPFRLFGLTRPDLDLAIASFNGRRCKQKGCWVQDPIQAAMLGLAEVAKDYTSFALTRRDPALKFPAFWAHGNDYQPDQDNGGNGENGLQNMLLQSDGRTILLLPAWPKGWDVSFRLHAAFQTTVSCRFEQGAVTSLQVDPPQRRADILDLSHRASAPSTIRPVPGLRPGTVRTLLAAGDQVIALKQTVAGKASVRDDQPGGEGAANAIDGSLSSKYFNRSNDGANPSGVGSGLLITPAASGIVTAFQIATANDMPDRDPLAITIEGSDDSQGAPASFVLLYAGVTGLDADPGRQHWGPCIAFANAKAFTSYRVLVTETRGDNTDGTQYSEFRLGTPAP
jgi:hypothetical protein